MNNISHVVGLSRTLPMTRFAGKSQQPLPFQAQSHVSNDSVRFSGGKWGMNTLINASALAGLTALVGAGIVNEMVNVNPFGVHSVFFDERNGGHQSEVHGPGLVYPGFRGLFPFWLGGGLENVPLNTNHQIVTEVAQVTTGDQKVIPRLAVTVDYSINPKYLPAALKTYVANIKEPAVNKPTSTFAQPTDFNVQKVYNQLVQVKVADYLNNFAGNYTGENFHTITDHLSIAMKEGLPNYPVHSINESGELVVGGKKDFPSLQQLVGNIVTINGISVTEIQLPKTITDKLEDQAKKPLEQKLAEMKTELAEFEKTRNEAKQTKEKATQQEDAVQKATLDKLKQTNQIAIKTAEAEKTTIETTATATYQQVVEEGNRDKAIELAKGNEEAAKIISEADALAAKTRAKAEAGVDRAKKSAEAEAAKLKGEPYSKYPILTRIKAIEGASEALSAFANNPNLRIRFVDPNLNIQYLNINGQDSSGGLVGAMIAADKAAAGAAKKPVPKPAPAAESKP